MKNRIVIMLALSLTVVVTAGCGLDIESFIEADQSISQHAAPGSFDASDEASSEASEEEKVELKVPNVKDGELHSTVNGVEVRFEWDRVEEADGYEVFAEVKPIDSEVYQRIDEFGQKSEVFETKSTFYIAQSEGNVDYRLKVRAYKKKDGLDRYRSAWSPYVTGSSYDGLPGTPVVKAGVLKDDSKDEDSKKKEDGKKEDKKKKDKKETEKEKEVYFEWDKVEDASYYKVQIESKKKGDSVYGKVETFETEDTNYVCTAKDDTDFRVQVTAVKILKFEDEVDTNKTLNIVEGKPSEYATGKTY